MTTDFDVCTCGRSRGSMVHDEGALHGHAFESRLVLYSEAACTLAHNLAVAGFGALVFRAGDNFGFHMGADESQCTCQWAPGEPYRPSSRCEQEDGYDDRPESMYDDDVGVF